MALAKLKISYDPNYSSAGLLCRLIFGVKDAETDMDQYFYLTIFKNVKPVITRPLEISPFVEFYGENVLENHRLLPSYVPANDRD